jgi:hypothetical protein
MNPERFKAANLNRDRSGYRLSVPSVRPAGKAPAVFKPVNKPAVAADKSAPKTNVTINIHVPKLRLPSNKIRLPKSRPRLPDLPYKLIVKRLVPVAVVVVCAFIVYGVISHIQGKSGRQAEAAPSGAVATAPSFKPAVPKDRPELANAANNSKAAFDGNRDVYSFQDTLLGTTLIVSEQPLPAKFSSAEQAVSQIAGAMGAKEPIPGRNALMKTEAKNGSQTIVTSVKGLLVFIQSPFRHSAEDWKNYLGTLD